MISFATTAVDEHLAQRTCASTEPASAARLGRVRSRRHRLALGAYLRWGQIATYECFCAAISLLNWTRVATRSKAVWVTGSGKRRCRAKDHVDR